MSTDRKKWKDWREDLKKRQQEDYNRKDFGGKFKSFLEEFPEGIKRWKCTEDEHIIDIIPYIAGKNDPYSKKGSPIWFLDVFIHRNIGPDKDTFICLNKTYGEKCAACELREELMTDEDADEETIKGLNFSRRSVINVWCHDSKKQENLGIQIWEVSHKIFTEILQEQAKLPKAGGSILFSDPDIGKNVCFIRQGKGQFSTKYSSFHFTDREEPIPDEIMDSALCLDSYIYRPTFEEVYETLHPTHKARKEKEEEDEDEEEQEEKQKKKKVNKEEEEGEEDKKFKKKKSTEKEEEEEDQKSKKKITKKLEQECEYGHEFGKDAGNFKSCRKCSIFEECDDSEVPF